MCGFNHIWLSHNVVNEDIFMLEFKQRVIDTFLNEAISFFEESPKCHFYKFINIYKYIYNSLLKF